MSHNRGATGKWQLNLVCRRSCSFMTRRPTGTCRLGVYRPIRFNGRTVTWVDRPKLETMQD